MDVCAHIHQKAPRAPPSAFLRHEGVRAIEESASASAVCSARLQMVQSRWVQGTGLQTTQSRWRLGDEARAVDRVLELTSASINVVHRTRRGAVPDVVLSMVDERSDARSEDPDADVAMGVIERGAALLGAAPLLAPTAGAPPALSLSVTHAIERVPCTLYPEASEPAGGGSAAASSTAGHRVQGTVRVDLRVRRLRAVAIPTAMAAAKLWATTVGVGLQRAAARRAQAEQVEPRTSHLLPRPRPSTLALHPHPQPHPHPHPHPHPRPHARHHPHPRPGAQPACLVPPS